MLFLWPWLKDHLEYELTPAKAAELLTRHSFAVESMAETPAGPVLEIEILPNRAPDCFSHLGVARELNALAGYLGFNKLRGAKPKKTRGPKSKALSWVKVNIADKSDCSRYSLKYFTNVKIGPSPVWLKERLKALGVELINNVVDAANYAMLDTGQPLHAFDAKVLKDENGRVNIEVRRSKGGETVLALDGQNYALPAGTLVIASSDKILAIAGIKGAVAGSITDDTTEVLVESANFNAPLIYQCSHQLNLRTDASNRFSAAVSPELTKVGLEKMGALLKEVAGAREAGQIDNYPGSSRLKMVALLPDSVSQRAGAKVEAAAIRRALVNLGFKVGASKQRQSWRVTVPDWRQDIEGEQDLIEEALRFYGYEKIDAAAPNFKPASLNTVFEWLKPVRQAFQGLGFDEVATYALVPQSDGAVAGLNPGDLARLALKNYMTSERAYLRASLMPGLWRALVLNLRHTNQLRLVEYGRVFAPQSDKIVETRRVAGLMVADRPPMGVAPQGQEFYLLKGYLETMFAKLGFADVTFGVLKNPAPFWHPGRATEIWAGETRLGIMGEVAPRLRQAEKVLGRAVGFELDLEPLTLALQSEYRYTEPPRYPAVLRDISMFVKPEIVIQDLTDEIYRSGGDLVEHVELFDWFEDAADPENHQKSLAFHVVYRSRERTLTDVEVDAVHGRIGEALKNNFGATIR